MKIELRFPRVSDAKRFCEILNHPHFLYLCIKPSLAEEIQWIKDAPLKRKKNFEYNYAILFNGKLIGGCGIKIDQHRPYIGEIGYFIDEAFWGKGILPKAVKLLEKIGFEKFGIIRMTILMHPKNKASKRVAIKCGYRREGYLKKSYINRGVPQDSLLYAKVR